MSNPMLPNDAPQVTQEDLLLIIGDQTVTISVLRQLLQNQKAGFESQRKQLENALHTMARERDELKAKAIEDSIYETSRELRDRVEKVRGKVVRGLMERGINGDQEDTDTPSN